MCTVTYIPKGPGDYILTSNRDENWKRSPQQLTQKEVNGQQLTFPRDTAAGGTWIVCSSQDRMVCLLNGAFEKHSHRPPYRRSRGLMVLDHFDFPDAKSFFSTYEFEGMEPFTMIIYDRGQLWEARWDEQRLHTQQLDENSTHIWSSSTLYPPPIRTKRVQWFEDWKKGRTDFSLEAIYHLHRHGGEGDPENDYVMNRDGKVQTVSITQVVKMEEDHRMIYHDLLRDNRIERSW
jgi:uncharacterized protein with NRDE domain